MGPRVTYQHGDHVCGFYSTPAEQLDAAIEFIKAGLLRCERCFYICSEHEVTQLRAALRKSGVHVETEEKRTALVLVPKDQGHLTGGSFDPERMIDLLGRGVEDALAAGFEGLCAAGDMNWVLDGAPGSEQLADYEARLNDFFRSQRALGLCLYNRRTLPPDVLDHGLATHEYVRVDGPVLLSNPFYEHPEQARRRTAQPEGVYNRIDQIQANWT
jgi:hypothetical protein